MVLSRFSPYLKQRIVTPSPLLNPLSVRTAIHSKNGTVLPEPSRVSFGLLRVFLTVTAGVLIGAAISKNMANFLEENELFVPSDDDDDDD